MNTEDDANTRLTRHWNVHFVVIIDNFNNYIFIEDTKEYEKFRWTCKTLKNG